METAPSSPAVRLPLSQRRRGPPMIDFEAMKRITLPPLAAEAALAGDALRARQRSQLRVATWNVWFDEVCKDERIAGLLREALRQAPDALCLQEVLPELATALRSSGPLTELYDISPLDVGVYGCLILAHKDLEAEFTEVPLTTCMGRSLILAECRARFPHLTVATTHLESLKTERIRRVQLQEAAAALRDKRFAVLCGDFNFDATRTFGDWQLAVPLRAPHEIENQVLQEVLLDFVDAWPALHSDPGFTFDGAANPMCVLDEDERMRYDRILARRTLVPVDAWLMGREPINQAGFTPSDHFGVLADFSVA
ncbi:unnamed protein product [Polarella glacialis]|uniref:Endonuclease/exonuclease/phosphatase domain-containing protein n=1 Tax=Polarella glacialis TaxID=89957 RepID=A0A813LH71_POLGL|nr:unnamed protein product [Polarella glacialis]